MKTEDENSTLASPVGTLKSHQGNKLRGKKTMQGKMNMKGHEMKGHEMKGHEMKGHGMKGHKLKGHQISQGKREVKGLYRVEGSLRRKQISILKQTVKRRKKAKACRRPAPSDEFHVDSAWYASKSPNCWLRSPVSYKTPTYLFGYQLDVFVTPLADEWDYTAHCDLFFGEPLPATLLNLTTSSGGVTYTLDNTSDKSLSYTDRCSAFDDTRRLGMGGPGDDLHFLVSLKRGDHRRPVTALHSTVSCVMASIERHLLTHEFNEKYLQGRAQIDILQRALMIDGNEAGQRQQNRGEVVGDALYEVMLVRRSVTNLLEGLIRGKTANWKTEWKSIQRDLTNRDMQNGFIETSAHQYIRRTSSATIYKQPRERLERKDIPDATERIICAVYESTLKTTRSHGWLEGDCEAVVLAMTALGTRVQPSHEVWMIPRSITLVSMANMMLKGRKRPKQRLRRWMAAAEKGLGYTFQDEGWLRVAALAVIQSDFDKTVGKAITVLGLAVIKLLSSMYAYFHGADSKLGQTPTNIDHTKRAWVRRSNIAELNARLGLPEVGIADASQSSFLRLVGAAYLDSKGDLSKGPAHIMRQLLAGQGSRMEDAIELSDGEDEQDVLDAGRDEDFTILSAQYADYIDLMSSDEEGEDGMKKQKVGKVG